MTSFSDPIPSNTTVPVVYDPKLPHVDLRAPLEKMTDEVYRRSLAIAKFESMHLSPAGEQEAVILNRWLEAFNNGKLSDQDRALLRETGGLQGKVESISQGRIVCIAKGNLSDQFLRIEFAIEQPVKIEFVPPPANFKIEQMSESELIKATRVRLSDLTKRGQFSGTVIIAKHGEPILSFFGGLPGSVPNGNINIDTKFNLGSMNKMFTAIGIMKLVQNKLISLDDYIGKYLPNYPNQEVRNVTIRQLLSHTGGTGDIFGPEFDQNVDKLKHPQDYIDLFAEQRELTHTPGDKWEYSNYGYVLLGRIIEVVSEQDYYQYIQENIYNPAGMANSGSFYQKDLVGNLATGLMFNEQSSKLESNASTLPVRGSPAGGGYSTAPNLLNFANALREYRLLDPSHTELLTLHLVDTGANDRYGYGFAAAPEGETPWFGHTGGCFGVNSSLDIYPDSDYTVIIMTNLDRPTANREAQWVRARLPTI